jgi:UDP-glucose 4-epimerase
MTHEFESIFAGRKILVTGGLGFLGSNLAHRLVQMGSDVILVDSLVPEYGGNLFNIAGIEDRVKVNISDVRDEHSMKSLVQNQDYLFNLAGQTSHMDSMQDPLTDLEINAKSQLFILEACRHFNPQIYGTPQYLPVDEKHPLQPVDINGVNKLAGEWYHLLYHQVYGIQTSVLRLTNTIGPRMRVKDARQTFLGLWVRLLVEGKTFEVWGGHQLRDFTSHEDVVDALLMASASAHAKGRVFNLGGDRVISLQDLADLLVAVNGGGDYKVRQFPADRKRIDIGDYYADFSLARSALGWEPKVALQDSLKGIVDYYREHLQQYV